MISTCDLHLFAPSETILEFLEGSLVPAPSLPCPFLMFINTTTYQLQWLNLDSYKEIVTQPKLTSLNYN